MMREIGLTPEIASRMVRKFLLEGIAPGNMKLDPLVKLVTDLDELLNQHRTINFDVSATATLSGPLTLITCPDGMRWEVWLTNHLIDQGDNTATNFAVIDVSEANTALVLDATVSTTRRITANHFWMEQGDYLRVSMGGAGVAATNVIGTVHVRESRVY